MDRIGKYKIKPFTKHRQNVVIITREGWRKRSVHAILEIDVTKARELITKNKEKTGENISFTGWIVKCVAQTISEHKDFNAYRQGKRKIVVFDDIDIAIPVERSVDGEEKVMAYIIRKVNEKSIKEITKEIRTIQKENVDKTTQVLGRTLTRFERIAINSPVFIQRFFMWIARNHAILKKKHMGTTGVTAIGMKGKFPGWVIPVGGTATTLFVVGGITKKPGVVDDKIVIREYLHLTITGDHDLIDGGPLARFVSRLTELIENAFELTNI